MRLDGRRLDALRPFEILPGFLEHALGSALVISGRTRVICTANLDRVPPFVQRGGWLTAEYAMLPGATAPRGSRDPGGRGKEIQRLIGRSLRAAVDLAGLVGAEGQPIAMICDCDVISADGGTRTAAITGAYVALQRALSKLVAERRMSALPALVPIAAVSVGLVEAQDRSVVPMLDLCYEEDSRAGVDLNVVQRKDGSLVEIQGTAERDAFTRAQLDAMLDLADGGLRQLFAVQAGALAG